VWATSPQFALGPREATVTATTDRALLIEETADGTFTRRVTERTLADLPDHPVLIRVAWSSLNYKDALSASGHRGVTRHYPHTPGIDAAGTVVSSDDARLAPGQAVLVTGFDLGMNTPGGFGQHVRVPAEWVVPLPEGMSLHRSMQWGTAGLTAGLAVQRLRQEVLPEQGPVLVTGATGGVGSLAVGLLGKLGYTVAAVSGKPQAADHLAPLGAPQLLSREDALAGAGRPLLRPRWAGVVDTVGGEMLAAAIKALAPEGLAVACGNAASSELPLNVFPFILRGATLTGIDSATCPLARRREVWHLLAADWDLPALDGLTRDVGLDDLDGAIARILAGEVSGRLVVDLAR
jgi:putative YhdH/YhfP family quinone oxidoreductase